jgi:Tol biopolymer transport system component
VRVSAQVAGNFPIRRGGRATVDRNQKKTMKKPQIARPALLLLLITASASLATFSQAPSAGKTTSESLTVPGEKHLGNVRQLTFGGTNAEAYFSADDKSLIFMHSGAGVPCDQMYTMPVDTPDGKAAMPKLVSTGKGRTTCGYFFPKGDRILFSSTHEASAECPPRPDYSRGYVWPIYSSYEIYTAKPDGSDLARLTDSPGYDAESTISRNGKKIVFTSTRNGDLDVYTMNADGSDVRQLTHELGYDGGAFFSDDGKKIVYRSQQPKTPEEIADYKDLLSRGLIRPGNLEIWVMDADGKNKRQVTHNGAANFAPYFFPGGKRIIFASNVANQKDPSGFDLYAINVDGTGLEQITYHPDFDAFPMFSSDGKRLVWASNRNGKAPHETNIFIADWVE